MANLTQQAIKASFLKLLEQMPLAKITVKDIVSDCGLCRNTFYYHFQDIPSLLQEIVTEQTDALIRQHPNISSLEECFQVAFRLATKNRAVVKHIYDSVNRELFTQNALRLCESVVTNYIVTVFPDASVEDSNCRVVIRFLKCQLFGMCIDWVIGGMQDSAFADLERAIALCKGFPDILVERCQNIDNS